MPRGGRRVNAGRKPSSQRGVVIGLDGVRQPAGAALASIDDATQRLAIPPKDLTKGQRRFWETYAPRAIEQRTLIDATVAGFRELCEQWALKDAIADDIHTKGPTTRDAEAQLRTYVKLAQRVDSSLARFKLTGFGKPAETGSGRQAPAANPWAQVAAKK